MIWHKSISVLLSYRHRFFGLITATVSCCYIPSCTSSLKPSWNVFSQKCFKSAENIANKLKTIWKYLRTIFTSVGSKSKLKKKNFALEHHQLLYDEEKRRTATGAKVYLNNKFPNWKFGSLLQLPVFASATIMNATDDIINGNKYHGSGRRR